MNTKIKSIIQALAILATTTTLASQMNGNGGIVLTSSNGTTINAIATGDEYISYIKSSDGYFLEKNIAGNYTYAVFNESKMKLEPSEIEYPSSDLGSVTLPTPQNLRSIFRYNYKIFNRQ